jgi:hypothetical protein
MHNTIIPFEARLSLREKVRLNKWIAKDLADSFGGRRADYLIPLNKKLKIKIAVCSSHDRNSHVISA